MTIEAKVITHSISDEGIEIKTMQLVYPRFIHAEYMTHRMFSRNASSSRAIPVAKMIEAVLTNPAMPIHWGSNQPGMQAGDEVQHVEYARDLWKWAARNAASMAEKMNEIGLHKQVANRILEPFQHIHVVVTATEWQNFFDLRCHKDAQPEMQALAYAMHHASQASTPQYVANGGWHLPYVSEDEKHQYGVDTLIKMSAARCARVSYLTHEGKTPNVDEDIALYNRLVNAVPPHMSPVEHQAIAVPSSKFFANFRGWKQHRWDLERNT
jgi:thymidylate synthase ThyX